MTPARRGEWPGSSSGTWQGPFAYAGAFGYQTEPDSGLKLLGHRYYDPETGRFLSRDPIQDGTNWYAYGGGSGSPLDFADEDGLQRRPLWRPPMGTGRYVCPRSGQRFDPKICPRTGAEVWRPGMPSPYGPTWWPSAGRAKEAPRIPKPRYTVNPAHDPRSPHFDPRKTPLPRDAEYGYRYAVPSNGGRQWYVRNPATGQYYRYSDSNDGTAHFSGIVPKRAVRPEVRRRWNDYP